MSLLAIDMGSSSCKAVAFGLDGRVLAEASQSYSPEIPRPFWAEMPPDTFWHAFRCVTRSMARELAHDPVEALGISSHAETFVAVDADRRPVSPAILNMDARAAGEAEWLKTTLDPKQVFSITGLTVHAMYPLPKILWLREHQPEVFQAARQFLAIPSYLLLKLGLPPSVDYSLASRFLAFNVLQKGWSDEILAACGLSSERLAKPVPAGTVAGCINDTAAGDLGLPPGIPVVLGGHDQPCAALGMGVMDEGRVSASLGTYECLLSASESPVINDVAYGANLNTYCHVVPGRYVTLAYFPAGIMLEWFLGLLQGNRRDAEVSIDQLCAALEDRAPAGPSELLIAPHLLGTCNPDFNVHATGVISGLRPGTEAAHIYKGILEGVACEFAAMAELLRRVARPFHDVYVTGGGCRSRLGLKLRASISGCRLHAMSSPDAVCLGTAILAGVAAGRYSGFPEAVAQLVHVAETVAPDPDTATAYRNQAQRYRLLYSSLAGLRETSSGGASQGDQ